MQSIAVTYLFANQFNNFDSSYLIQPSESSQSLQNTTFRSSKTLSAQLPNNNCMPIITVAMFSGRTQREKDRFAEAITDDAVKILGVKREDVVIVFQQEPRGNWYASGVRL